MKKLHVKKDDMVTVISGESAGRSGRVIHVDPKKDRVTVEGINVGRKTVRRSQDNPQGGIVERERPMHVSNVMLEEKYLARQEKRGGSTPSTDEEN